MDPNATWKMLEDAMSARDREAVAESADDLIGWLEKGGFLPTNVSDTRAALTRAQWLVHLRDLRAVGEMA